MMLCYEMLCSNYASCCVQLRIDRQSCLVCLHFTLLGWGLVLATQVLTINFRKLVGRKMNLKIFTVFLCVHSILAQTPNVTTTVSVSSSTSIGTNNNVTATTPISTTVTTEASSTTPTTTTTQATTTTPTTTTTQAFTTTPTTTTTQATTTTSTTKTTQTTTTTTTEASTTTPTTTTVTTPAPAALEDTTTTTPKPKPIKLGPVVSIKSGQIRPIVLTSRKGREYYAFRGVPFSNPPIHFQRFKAPSPVAPWEGVLNATTFAPPCIQYNLLIDEIEGEEDCLHLNVFTPKLGDKAESGTKFPVIVFIHQGAFMFGSSRDYEAKYMMDNDVVLVTIAYRLGSFGFLNTEGGSDAYGNMGLKDQVLALQWIQDNIEVFNGEKDLVTIAGESAGAASVHYHLLSDKSKGLFSRAISMSGTALNPWAFTRNPRRNAIKLATMLNCPTTVMYELFICLQGVNATDLAKQHKAFFEWGSDPVAPFTPSVEVTPDEDPVFIKDTPYSLMHKGHINDNVPWMVGVVEDVCLLDIWSILNDPQLLAEMNVDWHRIAPLTFSYRETALEPDAVSNQIHAFYFGSKTIGNDTAQNLTNLYSDRLFNHGMRTSTLLHGTYNEAVPIYLYTVGYRGQQSHIKFLNIHENLGVSEGDELQYLFNMGRFDEIEKGHPDEEFSENFIKLWISFARDGKPSANWNGPEWSRMSLAQVKGNEALMFYRLDKNSSYFVPEPFADRMSFWDNLPLNENDKEVQSASRRSDLSMMDDLV